ncbi:hypothetical protein KAFR_0B00610 [Kazachstania africana CBS 2517]|uniref:Serine/threonine-protein phosphatase 4 regulatory subunit 2 n=1 Tax=Kazachstania africana (strain ATCC 22294 / BCRC 22015 / CBS 2517 / CECT 1963 / NBRC 1671 / NRRL Y-8276) TaxID=1071382 RepID=H2APR0_KAZAF|nr:hypothetical protein KAFR_0B00610 [Kazachstania africana CBS 2517]CCF56360.1 hypothetical protein KAFR_0B00610 [Kazachstania africana CBS 2517]
MGDMAIDSLHHMNGVTSTGLYSILTGLQRDEMTIKDVQPSELLQELIKHINETISHDIFQSNEEDAKVVKSLDRCVQKLNEFARDNTLPFTIIRICELCFDPLKYFKINELHKFANALEKCCFVDSRYKIPSSVNTEMDAQQENGDSHNDVPLNGISWLDNISPEEKKDIGSFIKDIDNIMTVNFGFEDIEDNDAIEIDEDADEKDTFVEDNEDSSKKRKVVKNSADFIVETYYEDPNQHVEALKDMDQDEDDDDDDDDDDDKDYIEGGDEEEQDNGNDTETSSSDSNSDHDEDD